MWDNVKLVIGILWASPVTLTVFLFYILPLWILGQYRYAGWSGLAWRWHFDHRKPKGRLGRFLAKRWKRWSGSAAGNIIVLKKGKGKADWESITEIHENEHVVQVMRLGVFQPVCYGLYWLVAKFALRHADPYYDNPMEVDARRAANQIIDVPGTVKRIKEAVAKKDQQL